MADTEQELNGDATTPKPRKTRQTRQGVRRVIVYRNDDGRKTELGAFPENVIGTPVERRLPEFLQSLFGSGEYKVDIRNERGHYADSLEFSVSGDDTDGDGDHAIDAEFADIEDVEPTLNGNGQSNGHSTLTQADLELALLKEKYRQLEQSKSNGQSDMQTMLAELKEARREQFEMMKLMLQRENEPRATADPTAQAMNILKNTLELSRTAKEISNELVPPPATPPGESSWLGDAANLMDTVGKHAPTFMPIVGGVLSRLAPTGPAPVQQPTTAAPATPSQQGGLSDLASKIQSKEKKSGA
jgi:hypothetical protein